MAIKKNKKLKNPFVYEGYKGEDYFCDRLVETENFISQLENGCNLTLVSPRKIGKTGLIKHAFEQIKKKRPDAVCIYTDIFHTHNQYELAQALGKAIIQEKMLDSRSTMSKVLGAFSAWRPVLSVDPMTGAPTVSVNIERSYAEHTIESVLTYLEKSEKEVFFAIDEFQTIADYPEKGTEALLRSRIQFMHNVHFVFSGSRQHLMYEMFGSPKRPFYQSTATMSLQPIHEEIYYDFAARFFAEKKGGIDKEVFQRLYEQFDGYTWYLQSVLNRLYDREKNVNDYGLVSDAILSILADKADQYETFLMFLTDNQRRLLTAVAKENKVVQPQANDFIQKYELPGSSSIKKALDVLSEKDIIYHSPEGYMVYDRFFDLWLKRIF